MCFVVILGFLFPRLILILGWIFGFISKGFEGWFWPLLGFIFAPITTIVYGLSHAYGRGVEGWWLAGLIFAIICDFGLWGGSKAAK